MRFPLRNGLLQTDLDCNGKQLVNLDTANLALAITSLGESVQPELSGTALDPTTLTWTKVLHKGARVLPIDENFLTFDERFEGTNITSLSDGVTSNTGGIDSNIADGVWTIPTGTKYYRATGAPNLKGPYYGVVARVEEMGAGYIGVGLSNGDSGSGTAGGTLRVTGVYDPSVAGGTFSFEIRNGSTFFYGQNQIALTMVTPFEIAVTIAERSASLFVREVDGGAWRYVTGLNIGVGFDSRDATLLSQLAPHLVSASSGAKLSRFYGGYAGSMGMANFAWVRFEDGSPVRQGRDYYFSASAVGGLPHNGNDDPVSIAVSYFCIYRFNIDSFDYEQVSKIFFSRLDESTNPIVIGDNAGNVIFDRVNDRFDLLASPWGTVSLYPFVPRRYLTRENLLSGVFQLSGSNLTLSPSPTNGHRYYDASRYQVPGTTTWLMALSHSDGGTFYPEVYISSDGISYTRTAQDSGRSGEGNQLQTVGGQLRLIVGTRTAAVPSQGLSNYNVYNVSAGGAIAFVGSKTMGLPAYIAPQSHFPILLYPDNGVTRALMIAFDGQYLLGAHFTEGGFVVYTATETQPGNEYPNWSLPARLLAVPRPQLTPRLEHTSDTGLKKIRDYTLPGAVSFFLIALPSNFTHIRLVLSLKGSNATAFDVAIRPNSDATAGNYLRQYLGAYGTTVEKGATALTGLTGGAMNGTDANAADFASVEITLPFYRATDRWKRALTSYEFYSVDGLHMTDAAGVWKSTDPIDNLLFTVSAGNFAAGCRITLYGMR